MSSTIDRPVPEQAGQLRRVASPDGTKIVIEPVTRGRQDVVMVPGGPSRRARWAAVADRLDGAFSCWLMDRRGKGESGDTVPYSFEREFEDLAAVLDSFPAPVAVAGHSSGATCVLGAALRGARVAALVLYEPPWPVGGPLTSAEQVDAVEALIDAGDRDGALELAFRDMVGMPAPAVEAMKNSPVWAEWRSLAHTWPREMREVECLPHVVDALAAITAPTLVLYGSLTASHLRRSTAAIAEAVPGARLVELPGQGHGALATAPDLMATAIRDFLPAP